MKLQEVKDKLIAEQKDLYESINESNEEKGEPIEDFSDQLDYFKEELDKAENVEDLLKCLGNEGFDYQDAVDYLFRILIEDLPQDN